MDYKKITFNLLKEFSSRQKEIVVRRFGLLGNKKCETLDSIGKSHNITRERVRQIEKEALSCLESKVSKKIFSHIEEVLFSFGGAKREDLFVSYLGKGKFDNEIFFFLVLNKNLKKVLEKENTYSLWALKKKSLGEVEKTIKETFEFLKKKEKPLFIEEIYNEMNPKNMTLPVFLSHIEISKKIQKSYEGKFGLSSWVEINPKGVKDRAYLVLKNTGKPLHFNEIASLIKSSAFFSSPGIHVATVHNELIKNSKFVLVGRGLYALREWGYEPGVVKDIISQVLLTSENPLTREEILKRVLEKRIVKKHTVFLNLQNKKFLRDKEGRYSVRDVKEI